MDTELLETRYLKVTKKCAKLAGVWPGQCKAAKYTKLIIPYVLVIAAVGTQVARIVCFFSLDTLLEQAAFIGGTIGVIIKQWNYVFNAEEYNALITGIRKDWLIERPQEEIDIITVYAERAYLLILVYLATAFSCLALFLQMPLTPRILDIVWPKNESRDLGYVYPAYYAVDEHKYHWFIIMHMTVGILVLTYIYVACDTSFMFVVQHACGLLAVTGYRFKTAIGEVLDAKDKASQDEIYRKVRHSIRGHQHALGSEMLWYNGNKKTQLLVLLALRSSITPPVLSAGGLVGLNVQTFVEIVKASVSYYTVLNST